MFKLFLIALYIIMPVAIMTTDKVPSSVFYAVIVICLALLFRQGRAPARVVAADYTMLILCYSAPVLAVLVSMLAHWHWSGSNFEEALRLSLGLPILLLALASIPGHALRQTMWGIYTAATAAAIYVIYLAYPGFSRPLTSVYNAVGYGNLLLLLAVITLFSLRWSLTSSLRMERVVKSSVAALAFAGFVITQTRSGWIAVPVFAVIGVVLVAQLKRPLRAAGLLCAGLIIITAIGASSESLRARAYQGYNEAITCKGAQNTTDNSVCVRFQLWRAAWNMFTEHPIIGLGDSGLFREKLQTDSLRQGIVSEFTASNFGEPHNDMMHALSSFGVLGGLGLLLVYFAPLLLFLRRLGRRYPSELRTAAAMGAVFCTGFAIFGITELMFRGMRTISFYVMFVALFAILSDPNKYQREGGAIH